MKNQRVFASLLFVIFALISALSIHAQNAADKVLIVNGKTVANAVREIDGHSYVDIEALAQATSAEVSIQSNRVVLTLPDASGNVRPPVTVAPEQPHLSRQFASAGVAAVADMREWRAELTMMVNYGLAVGASASQNYRDRADAGLQEAAVAASTDEDRDALQLLRNQFNALTDWANQIAAARQSLNGAKTVDPNGLENDPTLSKINTCSRFLNRMLTSGAFADDANCH